MSLLEIADLNGGYGASMVLHGISLKVNEGEIVVVLGANGAGKTTTMRAIAGLISSKGTINLDGKSIIGMSPDKVVKAGVALVPQGRGTFAKLSVEDNLHVGAATRRDRAGVKEDLEQWYDVFPRLAERKKQPAGTLSGGEQQMLAIARALMNRPRLLLCDEPSLGLAPLVVREVFSLLTRINTEQKMAMLIVEQNAQLALEIASRAYLLEAGTVVSEGTAASLRDSDAVRRAYLGY
ncbi:MAG: ABC transporter ATP-binding protein [Acidimicrobiales bacterium]